MGPMRPESLLYAVDEVPPPSRLAILGLQYAVQVAVYLVIVVIVLRHAHVSHEVGIGVLSCACVAIAIGTALQALPRGPVGSGFLAPPVFSAIYLAPSVLAAEIGGLPLVFGMTIFAALLELLLSFCLRRLQMASAASSSDCQGAFEPRLFELKSLFPGNGIFRAETKAPKRPRSFKGRYCRDKISLS